MRHYTANLSAKGIAGRLQGDNANYDGQGSVAPRRKYEEGRSMRLLSVASV